MPTFASLVDGFEISYTDSGAGSPALVFVPGLTGTVDDYRFQEEAFRGSHRVIRVEHPTGLGTRAGGHWTIRTLAADVADLLATLDPGPLVLIGHSLGGPVVTHVADLLGEAVRGVVWASSFQTLDRPKSPEELDAWIAPFTVDFAAAIEDLDRRNFGPKADPSIVDEVVGHALTAEPPRVLNLLRSKFGDEPEVTAALERLEVPVVAINGDYKPSDAAGLAAHGVGLSVLDGVGHFVTLEDPEAFNAELALFLQSLH